MNTRSEKTPVGMAIKLTADNAEKIAIVNGGVVPKIEEPLHMGYYFLFPYDADASTRILPGYIVAENWKPADDAFPLNEKFFVEIVEI